MVECMNYTTFHAWQTETTGEMTKENGYMWNIGLAYCYGQRPEAYAMNRIILIKSKTKHCGGHVSLVVNVVLLIESCDSLS